MIAIKGSCTIDPRDLRQDRLVVPAILDKLCDAGLPTQRGPIEGIITPIPEERLKEIIEEGMAKIGCTQFFKHVQPDGIVTYSWK